MQDQLLHITESKDKSRTVTTGMDFQTLPWHGQAKRIKTSCFNALFALRLCPFTTLFFQPNVKNYLCKSPSTFDESSYAARVCRIKSGFVQTLQFYQRSNAYIRYLTGFENFVRPSLEGSCVHPEGSLSFFLTKPLTMAITKRKALVQSNSSEGQEQ